MFNPVWIMVALASGLAMMPPAAWTMKLKTSARTNHRAIMAALKPMTLPSGCQYNTIRANVM